MYKRQAYDRDIVGDYFFNCANTASQQVWHALGLAQVCVSPELAQRELADLEPGGQYPLYGHMPLMNLRHCPVKKATGSCQGRKGENEKLCRKLALIDEKKREFPMQSIQMAHCLTQVLAGAPFVLERCV